MDTNSIGTLQPTVDPTTKQNDVDRLEIKRLAQEFEAMLMTQMLREMRRSMLDEEEQDNGLGAGALTDTADVELGRALSRAGGFGLTTALLKAFEQQIEAIKGQEGQVAQVELVGKDDALAAMRVGERRDSTTSIDLS